MIESMIEPLRYEMQLALLALQKTEELQYVAHSEGIYDPVPDISDHRRLNTDSGSHLNTTTFCMRRRAFRWAKAAILSTLRTGSLLANFKLKVTMKLKMKL